MHAITEFFTNAAATSRLKPKFYWTTSFVGILVIVGAMGVIYLAAIGLAASLGLGLELDAPIRESTNGLVWAALFLVSIPLSGIVSMVPIAWLSGLFMVRIGFMEHKDVKFYAWRSRYPAHWYKEEHPDASTDERRGAA